MKQKMNQQNNNQPVRRSRRHATIIPASQWISIGYSQNDARRMEELQNDMKKYYDNSDEINIKLEGMPRGGVRLPHHEMMLLHWQKFANALRGRASVEEFLVQNNRLPVPVLDIVFPALQTMNNLAELTLFITELGNDGFLRLSSFLRDNTSLVYLFLGGDTITDMSVARAFSDAINNHPHLIMLLFLDSSLSNDSDILEKILDGCTEFSTLVLGMNNFRSED
jgi:hypothetical protein